MYENVKRAFIDFLDKRGFYGKYKEFKLMDKTVLKFPVIGKKIPIFTIVPSFKCNIKCAYCQHRGLEKERPNMNLDVFINILKWLSNQNIKHIRFMGGELTINPLVKDYIKILSRYGFKIKFYSNLMINTKDLNNILSVLKPDMVDRFVIHCKDLKWYTKERRTLFLKNVAEINKKGYTIHLRHNLINSNTKYDYAIELAKKYSNIKYFTTIPSFPGPTEYSTYTSIEEWKNLVPTIIDIYKKCKKAKISFDFTRPLPPCFFTKEDFKKYYHKIGRNPCQKGADLFRPIVYPDQTVVFCPGVHLKAPKHLLGYKDYMELYFDFKDKFEEIRWKPLFNKCNECKFFKKKRCQGLCAGFKFYQHCKRKGKGHDEP